MDALFQDTEKLPAVTARYAGACPLCQLPIYPGEDLIVKLDGDWVHDHCAEDHGHEVMGNA